MNCTLCKHGETTPGMVTVTLTRGDTVVVLKEVPAEVCENCGEYYLDSATAERLYQQADAAVARRVEVEVLRYAA
ncbi:YgiT-type zinc finger domain protein [Thiorhodovibrio winogradskyi]|uniref:YgiT-type zinc finger domain protein n=1 Tax=Thiorhodovibrio winogradskyi TaxID=77007 RepID=A0ABZ0S6Z1_9GAMM|nr:type II toxin-antitoxin system MqsA family antitoxin [Thiorhodovibrio winogradskyi]